MEYKELVGSALARSTPLCISVILCTSSSADLDLRFAAIRLFWQSPSLPKELIPSSQLFYETHTQKSPFGLIVTPNVANGSQSVAFGSGLSVATAGVAASVTIQVSFAVSGAMWLWSRL
eukprot:1604441-Rhodomonas_salina.3